MDTYNKNGVCQYLRENSDRFFLTDLSKSLLVIAKKKNRTPLYILLDDRVDSLDNDVDDSEETAINIGKLISNKTKLPFFIVRYVDDDSEFDNKYIILGEYNAKAEIIEYYKNCKITEFINLLDKYSISAKIENHKTEKETNDKLSSGFHIWQRSNLKVGIYTDIDLISYDKKSDKILKIFELKRSTEPITSWKPHRRDRNNYLLIANICKLLKVPFYVLYNNQVKKPDNRLAKYYFETTKKGNQIYYDNVKDLKIFKMCIPEDGDIDMLEPLATPPITIDEFIKDDNVSIDLKKYNDDVKKTKEYKKYKPMNDNIKELVPVSVDSNNWEN